MQISLKIWTYKKDAGPQYLTVEFSRDGKIALTKWFDNKAVYLASNCLQAEPTDIVHRRIRGSGQRLSIPRPNVVRKYNKCMGGVDHLDQMLAYYRIFRKSRNWTLRVAMHFVDFAVATCWMLYRRECAALDERPMDLLSFRIRLTRQLLAYDAPVEVPRTPGRPPAQATEECDDDGDDEGEDILPAPRHKVVPSSSRFDNIGHIPTFDDAKNASRCKVCYKQKSMIKCEKCNVYLCIKRGRNHFAAFHKR